ncbi:hypothetical protein Q666_13195 [Marinobacter sp. ES-1]|jgi:hypothetical protein|nr:hypothetical protein Q666_13195 [Marinobacter sp. ES-1]
METPRIQELPEGQGCKDERKDEVLRMMRA